jgi:hypothetical protein
MADEDVQFELWIDMLNIKICEICLALIQEDNKFDLNFTLRSSVWNLFFLFLRK